MADAALPSWLSLAGDGVVVEVKAVPRARRTRAAGVQHGALRVQIAAAPHKGHSNAALCAYLADRAGVRATTAAVRRGASAARTRVEIRGDGPVLAATLVRRIGEDLASVPPG